MNQPRLCGTRTPVGQQTPTRTRLTCTQPRDNNQDHVHGAPVGKTGWHTWTD